MSFISGGNWNSSLITLDSLKNNRAHIQNDDELDLDSEVSLADESFVLFRQFFCRNHTNRCTHGMK